MSKARRDAGVTSAAATTRTSPPPVPVNTTTARALGDFEQSRGGFAREELFEDRRVDQSPDDALVGVDGRGGEGLGGGAGQALPNDLDLGEIALRAEQRELRCRLLQVSLSDGSAIRLRPTIVRARGGSAPPDIARRAAERCSRFARSRGGPSAGGATARGSVRGCEGTHPSLPVPCAGRADLRTLRDAVRLRAAVPFQSALRRRRGRLESASLCGTPGACARASAIPTASSNA